MTVTVKVQFMGCGADDLALPRRWTPGAAGFDLAADLDGPVTLKPNVFTTIGTGMKFEIPEGCYGDVRPRAGVTLRNLLLMNSPGTIDSDCRGEVMLFIVNTGEEEQQVFPGERLAQLIIHKTPEVEFAVVDKLSDTLRGAGGFGSTGR